MGDIVKNVKKLPNSFFSKYRGENKKNNQDDYSKIEEIKCNKDILCGKNKIIGSLPKNKKMI